MNRRGFLQGLFAAVAAPLVPDVLRPSLLDALKAGTVRAVTYIQTGNEWIVTEFRGHFANFGDTVHLRDGQQYRKAP